MNNVSHSCACLYLAADSKFGMAKAVFWCHFMNNFIGALFFLYACTKAYFFLEKCAVMIALPHQTDIEREKVLLNRDKYINKHTELRMIWHQNGTEPLIDTDLETHQEIRENTFLYTIYVYICIARNISFIFFSSSNSRSIIQNTGTQLKYYNMCMCVCVRRKREASGKERRKDILTRTIIRNIIIRSLFCHLRNSRRHDWNLFSRINRLNHVTLHHPNRY